MYGSYRGFPGGKMRLPLQTSLDDYFYIFPGNFDHLHEADHDVLNFHSSSWALMKNDTSITQDGQGVYTFLRNKQALGEHHGYYISDSIDSIGKVHHGSYHQFAFVFVLPTQFEILSYHTNCTGKWSQKSTVLSLFATDVNDIDIEVKFRKRQEVIKHDTIVARCEELQRLYDKLAEEHRTDSLAREDVINKLCTSAASAGDNVEIVNTSSGVHITVSEKLLFTSGNATVGLDGIKVLNSVAEKIKSFDRYHVVVSGYTDNVPIAHNGKYANNWQLSSARALNVSQLLIDDGLPDSVIEVHAFGATKPKASNETSEGRASNRRIEIEVLKND